ncbi:MAG: hypothetical protein JSW71_22510 [Gemmatimonadota bacterium]|nr:MAG: hypothetical protein JSW71_22510 [Gemmatimonadota bacterium]
MIIRICAAVVGVLLVLGKPDVAACQETSGSTEAAIGGAALGAYSGVMLGTVGSIVPCTQTYWGDKCVRWSAVGGGVIGVVSGAVIGANDADHIERSASGAAIGFSVGFAAGLVLKSIAQRVGWQDAAAVGLLGGAMGAAPKGAVIGLGLGTVVGFTLSQTVDGFKTPDLVGAAVGGATLGALTDWIVSAVRVSDDPPAQGGTQITIPFSVSF